MKFAVIALVGFQPAEAVGETSRQSKIAKLKFCDNDNVLKPEKCSQNARSIQSMSM